MDYGKMFRCTMASGTYILRSLFMLLRYCKYCLHLLPTAVILYMIINVIEKNTLNTNRLNIHTLIYWVRICIHYHYNTVESCKIHVLHICIRHTKYKYKHHLIMEAIKKKYDKIPLTVIKYAISYQIYKNWKSKILGFCGDFTKFKMLIIILIKIYIHVSELILTTLYKCILYTKYSIWHIGSMRYDVYLYDIKQKKERLHACLTQKMAKKQTISVYIVISKINSLKNSCHNTDIYVPAFISCRLLYKYDNNMLTNRIHLLKHIDKRYNNIISLIIIPTRVNTDILRHKVKCWCTHMYVSSLAPCHIILKITMQIKGNIYTHSDANKCMSTHKYVNTCIYSIIFSMLMIQIGVDMYIPRHTNTRPCTIIYIMIYATINAYEYRKKRHVQVFDYHLRIPELTEKTFMVTTWLFKATLHNIYAIRYVHKYLLLCLKHTYAHVGAVKNKKRKYYRIYSINEVSKIHRYETRKVIKTLLYERMYVEQVYSKYFKYCYLYFESDFVYYLKKILHNNNHIDFKEEVKLYTANKTMFNNNVIRWLQII